MKIQKIDVVLSFFKPILFNKFCGIKDEEVPTEKKFDLEDGKVVIYNERIYSFLTDAGDVAAKRNTYGAIKMFAGRKHKELIVKANAYVGIEPIVIFLERDGKPIKFEGFGKNGIRELKAKTGKGKPQEVKRPLIEASIDKPVEVQFRINLTENQSIDLETLKGWFIKGGIEIGIGAWRPRHGQFVVKKFEGVK